jgi:hypothetical protein
MCRDTSAPPELSELELPDQRELMRFAMERLIALHRWFLSAL